MNLPVMIETLFYLSENLVLVGTEAEGLLYDASRVRVLHSFTNKPVISHHISSYISVCSLSFFILTSFALTGFGE